MSFTSDYQNILSQIESIDPIKYGKTRNYLNGAVTRLSPYISRGLINTRQAPISIYNAVGSEVSIDWKINKIIK